MVKKGANKKEGDFDKTEYNREYDKKNYRVFRFRVRYDDIKTIDHLNNIDNINSYILNLIKKDIKK